MNRISSSVFSAAFILLSPALLAGQVDDGYFHTSDGVQLHYLESGTGDLLVFVPGWKVPAEVWDAQIEHFSINFRVVALDPRGQGRSEKPLEGNYLERRAADIHELLRHLGGGPAVVVGWSLAVWEIASMLEQFGPDAVRGVVLVDYWLEASMTLERLSSLMRGWGELQRDPVGFTERLVRGVHAKPQPEGYIGRIIDLSLQTPSTIAFAVGANSLLMDRDWWPVLEAVELPILYMVRSRYEDSANDMRQRVPTARVEVFNEAGHALFWDEPQRFNRVLEEFISSLPKESRR